MPVNDYPPGLTGTDVLSILLGIDLNDPPPPPVPDAPTVAQRLGALEEENALLRDKLVEKRVLDQVDVDATAVDATTVALDAAPGEVQP